MAGHLREADCYPRIAACCDRHICELAGPWPRSLAWMLTPPDGLSEDTLVRTLEASWGLVVASIEYEAVGFGSHHWVLVEPNGVRWFVSVDDLDSKRQSTNEPGDAAFGRLLAALATARDLRDSGLSFVVAPMPALGGELLVRLNRRFVAALYPYVDGQSYSWGEAQTAAQRRDLLNLIVALHAAPAPAARHAIADDFAVPQRDMLESAFDRDVRWNGGPYSSPTGALITENVGKIRQLLVRYDDAADEFRRQPTRMVLTHGEPHPGNTMLTPAGLMLIDWDMVLLAPPERDLWILEFGDGSVIGVYAEATGTTPLRSILDLYRTRWDLADLAVYVNRFRGPHSATQDDEQSWDQLCSLIGRLPT